VTLEGSLEEKTVIKFSKLKVIVIIILLSIPISFILFSNLSNPEISIGIIMVDDALYSDCETARASLVEFHDAFNAQILDVRFNESGVRTRKGSYLTNDYFESDFAKSVRDQFDVDMILIFTNRTINNWLGEGDAIWGQANTQNAMAVITTKFYHQNSSVHDLYIRSTTIHEILHLLGYEHFSNCQNCVTQYSTLDMELCYEHNLELPYRLNIWKAGYGQNFGSAIFAIKLIMYLAISPIFIVLMVIIQNIFKKFMYKSSNISQIPLIFGIGLFYFNIVLLSGFVTTINYMVVYQLSLVFLYIIFESISFERQNQSKEHSIDKQS
jgi:hypothetical protein